MYFYKYENFNKENNYASYFDNKIFTYNHMTKPLDHFGIFNILNIIYISFNGFLIIYFNKNIDFNQKILLLFISILIISTCSFILSLSKTTTTSEKKHFTDF